MPNEILHGALACIANNIRIRTTLIFIALVILTEYFKMNSLIEGYNNVSKKENIDIKKLADVLSNEY
ncbi:MAG: hypothetical protein ACJA2M_002189 [Polaribacter sp.]|jgi:hypothetical protein